MRRDEKEDMRKKRNGGNEMEEKAVTSFGGLGTIAPSENKIQSKKIYHSLITKNDRRAHLMLMAVELFKSLNLDTIIDDFARLYPRRCPFNSIS